MARLSRPVRPGAVAAFGDDLWVVDRTRPLVARIHRGALAGVVRWEGERAVDRLHADGSGAWLVGGGVRHWDTSGHLRLLDPVPAGASTLSSGTPALTPEPRWPTPTGPSPYGCCAATARHAPSGWPASRSRSAWSGPGSCCTSSTSDPARPRRWPSAA